MVNILKNFVTRFCAQAQARDVFYSCEKQKCSKPTDSKQLRCLRVLGGIRCSRRSQHYLHSETAPASSALTPDVHPPATRAGG
jgi:hypothetical protein